MRQQVRPLQLLLCLAVLGLLEFGALPANAEVAVEASLSHRSFPQDKVARLTITVTGTSRDAAIALPEIADIRLHNRGTSSQFSMINGSISSSTSHNYLVQAERPGSYTIPPIEVSAGGKTYATRPLSFEVTPTGRQPGGVAGSGGQAAGDLAFIRISKTSSHYPGEMVPLTIKAYFTQAYRADINSLPTLRGDGVVMSPLLSDKPEQTEESVNGRRYHVLTWNTSLSGIKVGEHPISLALDATMLIPQKRRGLSPFGGNRLFDDQLFDDPAFDSFFGGQQRRPIVAVSPEVVFKVLPLPRDKQPDTFTGAIGDFELKVSASPVDVEIGEPITLTMEISGKGNFDRVEAPVFPEGPDWKTYPATAHFAGQKRGSSGVKTFEQAIVAKSGSLSAIPPLSFSYFDPGQQKYITRTSTPVAIRLHGTAAPNAGPAALPANRPTGPAGPQQPAGMAATAASGFNLAPIHLDTGTYAGCIVPLFWNLGWIGVCSLCVLMLSGLAILRLRRRNIEKHPEITRQREKKRLLESDLKRVEQAQAIGDSLAFLAAARTAIQNQLGLLWQIEPAALSLADLRTRLPEASPLIALFGAAEEAAYGGATLTDHKMRDYLTTLTTELEKVL